MQLYLQRESCFRGVLSQFLDERSAWRWCMANEDEACKVCGEGHTEARSTELEYRLADPDAMVFTGPEEVLRQDYEQDQVLDQYEQDLEIMVGTCLYCRLLRKKRFDHAPGSCARRFDWIKAKKAVLDDCKQNERRWIEEYLVCYRCYQPQEICRVADLEHEETTCRFSDLVIPACYGAYKQAGGQSWIRQHFERSFENELAYMLWLGEKSALGGNECIQANCVAAVAMAGLG